MKKVGKFLIAILLAVPMLIGTLFLSPNLTHNATQTTQNGVGGGKPLLDSPKTGDNSDFDDGDSAKIDADIEQSWIEPTIKSYEDYFIDFDIKQETITDDDLLGNGSLSTPYIVRSTRGFLYLFDYGKSGLSLSGKYIVLSCDIVLNEEKFDKYGKVSGGDGVVYIWKNDTDISVYTVIGYINGNNHSISGLFATELDESTGVFTRSLFGYCSIRELKNLKIKNVFIYGGGCKYVNACGYMIGKISNCQIDGRIIAKGESTSSFFYIAQQEARNCISAVDIDSRDTKGIGGLFHRSYYTYDCTNYGNLTMQNAKDGQARIGGITCYSLRMIKGCVNYGTISGYAQCGGISGFTQCIVENCTNYGKINAVTSSGGVVARGDVYEQPLVVKGCKNFGSINGSSTTTNGEIVGHVSNIDLFILENCYALSSQGLPLFDSSHAHEIILKNCKVDVLDFSYDNVFLIFRSCNQTYENVITKTTVENVHIVVHKGKPKKLGLFSTHNESNLLYIENVLITSNVYIDYQVLHTKSSTESFDYNGVIFDTGNKQFYGSDFSDFFVDFKTGKLGLKALSGKGFYQGAVSEEVLLNKGFERKEI